MESLKISSPKQTKNTLSSKYKRIDDIPAELIG